MRFTWGIKTQVLLITFIPVIAVSIFLGSYFTRTLLHNMQDSLWKNGVATALELSFSAEQGVFYGNPDILQQATNKAVNREDIQAAAIFDKNHTLLAHSGNRLSLPSNDILQSLNDSFITIDTQKSIRFIAPISLQDVFIDENPGHQSRVKSSQKQIIGWVCVELARSTIAEKKIHVLKTSFFIVLLGLFISALFALRLSRNVINPILILAKALDKIRKGTLNTRVEANADGELKILQTGVNDMAQALEKNHDEMQHNIEKATQDLRDTLQTIEKQNSELILARKEALTASQVKSDFLANMSHEIRTPMNGILGFISLLLESDVNSLQKEYLEIVHQSSRNLLVILNDILDLSKFEAGQFDLENIPFTIRKEIKDALLILSANARSKNIQIISHIYKNIPETLRGDPFRLKQVITNLVSNAIKFTEKGSITIHCKVLEETEKDLQLKITVTDTGIGLRQEEQSKLFQAFSQTDASITRRHGGTGLGLVICKKIITQMKGEIGVSSEYGQGSSFWFTMTLEKDISGKIEEAPTINEFNSSIKILVVDDNEANLKLVSILLKLMNVSVVAAKDGYEAFKVANTETFNLILMDIQMPGLDGVATTRKIKENSLYNQQTPIVALTALSTPNEHQYFLKNGMVDCLTKPIGQKELREIVTKWVFKKFSVIKEEHIVPSAAKNLPMIDWHRGIELAGKSEDLAKELLTMFIESLPKDLKTIREAYQNKDITLLKDTVHRLHGGCCYCGVPLLKEVVYRFEMILKQTQKIDESVYLELIDALENLSNYKTMEFS